VRVTVLLFARLREVAGVGETVCDVAEGARVGDVWQAVSAAHPGLDAFAPAVSCAVNADFASMTSGVRDGDEIAFLPPVSGGSGRSPGRAQTC
jgi:molybdopterin converting factor subunit 1